MFSLINLTKSSNPYLCIRYISVSDNCGDKAEFELICFWWVVIKSSSYIKSLNSKEVHYLFSLVLHKGTRYDEEWVSNRIVDESYKQIRSLMWTSSKMKVLLLEEYGHRDKYSGIVTSGVDYTFKRTKIKKKFWESWEYSRRLLLANN